VAENGLWMLVAQAKEAAEWFTGCVIDDAVIQKIHGQLKLQMENIILIGMPGSGKSTVGRLLAKKLARYFVDADEAIIKEAGMPIPEIFATSGEEGFRQIETKVLARLGQESSLVIATGGGCVTRRENDPLLHQNGTIFCLQRDLHKLAVDGRPLSQANMLEALYHTRTACRVVPAALGNSIGDYAALSCAAYAKKECAK
jgi:shikimate dehydrogenase